MASLVKSLARQLVGGTPSPTPSRTFGLVANRFQLPTTTASIASPYTSRRTHFASSFGDISDLVFVDVDWIMHATDANEYTIKKFVEYPEGVFTQVTWGGQPTLSLLHGESYLSDPVPITIPAGAKFWERTVHITGVAKTIPLIELPTDSVTLGVDDGNASSDRGNVDIIAPSGNVRTMGSVACLGYVSAANAPSVVMMGDSIAFGQGDISGVGTLQGSGWVARALDDLGVPYMKMTKGGAAVADFVASSTYQETLLNRLTFSHLICEYGLNDVTQGRTQEQILADLQTLYGKIGTPPIMQTTLSPRSTSTDGYATVVNQTEKTDGSMAQLDSINAAIRAGQPGVDYVIEAADAFMSARDSGVWATPPVPTVDGTHPNTDGATAIAAKLKDQIGFFLGLNANPNP